MNFQDSKVLVTGGSSGIGEAIGERFVEEGADVIVFDYGNEPSYEAEYHDVDVRDREQIEAAFQEIDSLDVLVNNAGIYGHTPFGEASEEDRDVVDTNMMGYYWVGNEALPLLEESEGVIINISSALAERIEPPSSLYCATKRAINGFTEAWAHRYDETGVRVNEVQPGPIDTPMLREAFTEEELEAYRQEQTMNKIGEPENVANAVLFLASEENDFVNGATLEVDGGESTSSQYT